jgi:hypothetical protein
VRGSNADKHARVLAEQVAINKVADAVILQGGDFAVKESLVWQGSRRAILDASLCQRDRCMMADDVKEVVGFFGNLTSEILVRTTYV